MIPVFGCAHIRNDAKSHRILEQAYTLGFRHFDTAPSYAEGASEQALGEVFRTSPEVRIFTKLSPASAHCPIDMSISLESSLFRLRRDHVQGLYLHGTENGIFPERVISHFALFQAKDFIRSFGYTTLSLAQYQAFLRAEHALFLHSGLYQARISLFNQEELPQVQLAKASGKECFAASTLGGVPGTCKAVSHLYHKDKTQVLLGEEYVTPYQRLLHYVAAELKINPIVYSSNAAHLEELLSHFRRI